MRQYASAPARPPRSAPSPGPLLVMKKLIVGLPLPVRAGIAHAPTPASSTIIEVFIALLRFASWGLPRLSSGREADAPWRIAPASGVGAVIEVGRAARIFVA